MKKYLINTAQATWIIVILASSSVVDAKDFSCQATCGASNNSPYCLQLTESTGRGKAFAKLYSVFMSDAKVIEAKAMRSMFGISSDPCNRLDTILKDGVWTNRGGACRISAKVKLFSATTLKLAIDVPPRLAFSANRRGTNLSLKPASSMALLSFDDEDLNKDWGGPILEVVGRLDRVWFQVPNGCIQVPFQ